MGEKQTKPRRSRAPGQGPASRRHRESTASSPRVGPAVSTLSRYQGTGAAITAPVLADFGDAARIAGSTAGFRPGADTEREHL